MIRIQSANGRTLRFIDANIGDKIYYTTAHGFVSHQAYKIRIKMRSADGDLLQEKSPLFSIEPQITPNGISFLAEGNCELQQLNYLQWQACSTAGQFLLDWHDSKKDLKNLKDLKALPWINKTQALFPEKNINLILPILISLFALVALFFQWKPIASNQLATIEKPENIPVLVVPVTPPQKQHVEPATVEPIKEVTPPAAQKLQAHQAIDKAAKAEKALTQNLGFLKLVGKKDLKKIVGGLPTPALEATAGAGPGGKEGSGGQLLVGMGEGLRKTTVGNSGLTGLGGLGTKGSGGGLGGYGETEVGSGAGRAISTVPLSQDAVIEGGLERSLIQATIMKYLSQVRACYEEGLKRRADLIGQVTMNFEISGEGNINYSHVQRSSLSDRDVENCISNRMLSWKFPIPRGKVNVKVSYPFLLRPVKS